MLVLAALEGWALFVSIEHKIPYDYNRKNLQDSFIAQTFLPNSAPKRHFFSRSIQVNKIGPRSP